MEPSHRVHSVGLGQHSVPLLSAGLLFPTSTRVGKIKVKLTARIPQRVQKLPWSHIGRVRRQKKGEASPGSLGIEECSGCSSYLYFQALAGQAFFSPLWGCQQATCHIRAPRSSSGPRSVEKARQNKRTARAIHLLRPARLCLLV